MLVLLMQRDTEVLVCTQKRQHIIMHDRNSILIQYPHTVDVEHEVAVVHAEIAVLRADGQTVPQRRRHLDQDASTLQEKSAYVHFNSKLTDRVSTQFGKCRNQSVDCTFRVGHRNASPSQQTLI